MCLAIPGKILEFQDSNGIKMAKVDFGGVSREYRRKQAWATSSWSTQALRSAKWTKRKPHGLPQEPIEPGV